MQDKIYDSKVMFYMDTLEYLKRGGRIGTVSSMIGQALKIKPIISCNKEGIYYTVSLIRGSKQGKKKLLNEMLKFCRGHKVWIGGPQYRSRPCRRSGSAGSVIICQRIRFFHRDCTHPPQQLCCDE